MLLDRIERLVSAILILAIVAACAIVLRKSAHSVTIAPILNIDDGIANVAVALAQRGRYGFLSSPVQGIFEVDRTHAFFNYGPLYFYVAAALTWLMGPSLMLYRMLHPLGLVLVVLIAVWALRRVSMVGPSLFTLVIVDVYLDSHWPLARPDIMVSVCVVLMLVAVSRAIERGEWQAWFAAGFLACSAVTTHQIAAAMIPASAVIWFLSLSADPPGPGFGRRAALSLSALVLGGAAAALVYLVAIDFRVTDLLTLGTAGLKARARPYGEMLGSHFSYAWWPLEPSQFALVLTGFCIAAALAVAAPLFEGERRKQVLALVMPAVVAAVLYQLSLGFYGTNHTGYVILSQVTVAWAIATAAAVLVSWIREVRRPVGRILVLPLLVVALVAVGRADRLWASQPDLWETRVPGHTEIAEYVRQVVSPLPERARAWGSLYFGLDAGDRTDLVDLLALFSVAKNDFRPDRRESIAPDFIALGNYELELDFVLALQRSKSYLDTLVNLFPGLRYRPVRLVHAPPYGTARVYEQVRAEPGSHSEVTPEVAVNDGVTRQWSDRLSAPLDVTFEPTRPIAINVSLFGANPQTNALNTLVANLPPGFFLVDVGIDRPDVGRVGFVTATSSPYFYWRGGWANFGLPLAPYLPHDTHVPLLVDHFGGALYVSRFETPGELPDTMPAAREEPAQFSMRVLSVRRVAVLADEAGRALAVAVPPLQKWSAVDPGVKMRANDDGTVRLIGETGGDERVLVSPPIAVPLHRRVTLMVPTEVASGAVQVGLLDPDDWLASPTLMPHRVVTDTRSHSQVRIAVLNSSLGRSVPIDVKIGVPVMVPIGPEGRYVDRLMGCRSPYLQRPSECAR